jgi:hypothetical protein
MIEQPGLQVGGLIERMRREELLDSCGLGVIDGEQVAQLFGDQVAVGETRLLRFTVAVAEFDRDEELFQAFVW